jgi:type IV secretory pathway ATPase VirB11/archaellum biosynthesis ATPase
MDKYMSENKNLDFKVIKKIPLSKGISTKMNFNSKDNYKLKKIDNVPSIEKKKDDGLFNFKEIKKIKIDSIDKKDLKNKEDKKETKNDLFDKNKSDGFFEIIDNNNNEFTLNKDPTNLDLKENLEKKEHFEKNDIDINKRFENKNENNLLISKDNHDLVVYDDKHSIVSKKNIDYLKQLNNFDIKTNIYSKEESPEYILNNLLKDVVKPIDLKSKNDFFEILESKDDNLDSLLEKLNTKTNKLDDDIYLESFSFLNDNPKKEKIIFKSYDVKNLYSKIDKLSKSNLKDNNNTNKDTTSNYKTENLFEEIEIPDIFVIEDNVKDINDIVENNFIQDDEFVNEANFVKEDKKNEDIKYNKISVLKEPNFVLDNDKLKINSNIELKGSKNNLNKNKNFNTSEFNQKISDDDKDIKEYFNKMDFNKKDDDHFKQKFDELKNKKSKKYTAFEKKGLEYILPKDMDKQSGYIHKPIDKKINNSIDYSSLVFTEKINLLNKDFKKISDEYSIDDFTYVKISYDQREGLFYNIIQPELNPNQEKDFLEIKKIFFNTIDQNYYSFNKEKHNIEKYIEKIYDISIDRYSSKISDLEAKLFLKFIKNEFFGLGILTNLLLDKKIIEVNCSGEKSNISVYHLEYGLLKTNLYFKNISVLNDYVLKLTKNMGVYITPTHPIIDGYLPNGYKVEGIYSVGDTSSKGSSFIIKKYLDSPQTPISLISTGIGSINLFTYIWSAISENYKVIISGTDDSYRIFNSLLLFLPDKKIITVQEFERLKLPQKEWINKLFVNKEELNKKLVISQAISQKPDYLVVDNFKEDIFENSWYNIDIFSVSSKIISDIIDQLKTLNQKAIIINLQTKSNTLKNMIQIESIKEITSKKQETIIMLNNSNEEYTINLLESSLNIVEYFKKKKVLNWMQNSKIYNFKDFNNIVTEYDFKKEDLLKRLNIK